MKAGEWVEVRSKEEILRSLDKKGQWEGLPFMPEMFRFCGQRFKIYKRAHKTCDTVNPTRGRRLSNTVHLQLRCDGQEHGGCQAGCLIFWKEAWLKPVDKKLGTAASLASESSVRSNKLADEVTCSEEDVRSATRAPVQQAGHETKYVCQATQLPHFTTSLNWWDIRQYVEDYTSGNVTLGRIASGFIYACYYTITTQHYIGRPARFLYDRFQALWGGVPFPRKTGRIPVGRLTPECALNLQPGELVRVKSYQEILTTLDTAGNNRGLYFDAELVPYCGGTYRVRTKIAKFINEKTGRMSKLKTPAVILEGAWCESRYSDCRMFCPRSIFPWWREIWLERVDENKIGMVPASSDTLGSSGR